MVQASPFLRPFIDPLSIPPLLSGTAGLDGVESLDIPLTQVPHRFHRDLPPAQVWTYGGTVPGPTLCAVRSHPLKVRWLNHLPADPLLPVEQPSPLDGDCGSLPEARSVTHLHGAKVWEGNFMDAARNSDGYPDAWNLPGGAQTAFYPNDQPAACLWYHDHALGCTSRNVAAGLAGFYLLRDPAEDALKLPAGSREIPLMLQARAFRDDGALAWPAKASSEEVYGDVGTVNGTVWPFLKVQACRYRFRLLNASTARIFSLRLADPQGKPGPALILIGSDDGLLGHPVVLAAPDAPGSPDLVLGPGERADVVVDFAGRPRGTWNLSNRSQTDLPAVEPPIPWLMQFRVGDQPPGGDPSRIPDVLAPATAHWGAPIATRNIFFGSQPRADNAPRMLLNGLPWGAAVVERPVVDTVERWNLMNTTREWHSFHIHNADFIVIQRMELEMVGEGEAATASGHRREPLACEGGRKDTVLLPPGQLTEILIHFGPFPGRSVYHCHMLEHEDDDMMRPYELLPSKVPSAFAQRFKFDLHH